MAHAIETEIDKMLNLLNDWTDCDRANEDNHWMYYKLKAWLKKLDKQVEQYGHEVAEAELLEGLHEKGDIVIN